MSRLAAGHQKQFVFKEYKMRKFTQSKAQLWCRKLLGGLWLLCLPVYTVQAQVPAMKKPVTLHLSKTNLAVVIEETVRQTGLTFSYDRVSLATAIVNKINWNALPLQAALADLKENAGLEYEIAGSTIAVKLSRTVTQEQTGHLRGRVVDFETAQPLPGASVQLQGTAKGVVTDARGYYELKNVPAGEYTLLISYIGYQQNKIKSVVVEPGKTLTYDIKMLAGKSLDGVTITAGPRRVNAVSYSSEKEVISEIRTANAVVSGISNEMISKMADRNAAEIVKRIPGITVTDDRFIVIRGMNARYNQTYLNGNLAPGTELYTHAFAFDLLPTPIIDRILVYKSPTPDLFGDVTGGSVKIFTKNAKPVRHFDVGVQTGYRTTTTFKEGNTYKGGGLDWLGIDDGARNDASKALPGFAESYGKKPMQQQAMVQAFSPDLQIGRKKMSPDFQAFINYFDNFRIGAHARLYNFTMINYTSERRIQEVYRQTGNLYSMSYGSTINKDANRITNTSQSMEKGRVNIMENLLLKLNSRHSIELKNFFLNEGNKNTSVSISQLNQLPRLDSSQQLRSKDLLESFEQRTLYSGNLTGTHILGKAEKHNLQWNLGYNYYKQNVPDQRDIRFSGQNGFLVSAGSNNTAYRDVYLGMINRIFIANKEENYQASLDYTYTFGAMLKIKAGGYQLFKNRQVDRRFFQVNRAGLEGQSLSGFEYAPPGIHDNYGYSDPNLIMFREEDLGKVWSAAYFREDGKGLAVYDATQPTDNYVADERNTAAYMMGDASLLNNRLSLVGGLRMEDDRQRLSAAIVRNGAFVPMLLEKPLTVWLPSLNAAYTLADSALIVRVGYGKTVNRPEFREISPFSDYDFMNDVVITGNPALVTARIDNYDLRLEWYPRNHPDEMINVGFFYKRLKNPIEQVRNDQSGSVSFMPTNLSYWNADEAKVYGVEAEIRKSLSFIPGSLFRNLSVMINAALIRSKASKAPTTTDTMQYGYYSSFKDRQLQGQAPYVFNAGLFYENPGWGLKASVTYNISGPTIYAVSAVSSKDARGDGTYPNGTPSSSAFVRPNLLEVPRHQLDFSLTQRLLKSLNVKLNIQNLLDEPVRIAEDHNYDNKYTAEKVTGTGQAGGITGPLYEGDNIFRRFNTGRYLLLSFTYAF
jgi:TonB-dependent receptor